MNVRRERPPMPPKPPSLGTFGKPFGSEGNPLASLGTGTDLGVDAKVSAARDRLATPPVMRFRMDAEANRAGAARPPRSGWRQVPPNLSSGNDPTVPIQKGRAVPAPGTRAARIDPHR